LISALPGKISWLVEIGTGLNGRRNTVLQNALGWRFIKERGLPFFSESRSS